MRAPVVFGIVAIAATAISAQTAGTTFDVISIRRSPKNSKEFVFDTLPGGRLRIRNIYARGLLWTAFGGEHLKIVNEPSWLMEPYDVDAVMEGGPELTQEQLTAPMMALLEERCGLMAHLEDFQQTVYSLEIESGSLLKPSAPGTREVLTRTPEGLEYRGVSMARFAQVLGRSPDLQTEVTDKTGLAGAFDLFVDYEKIGGVAAGVSSFDLVSAAGLRLRPQKRPAKAIVIDKIHKPSEN